jgi:hypothetical protein
MPWFREKDQTLEFDLGQFEKSELQLAGLDAVSKQIRRYAADQSIDDTAVTGSLREAETGGAHDGRRDVGGGALHGVVQADQVHFGLNVR